MYKRQGKEIPEEEIDSYEGACDVEADDYTQKTYTVVAEILVPSAMNCRYYGCLLYTSCQVGHLHFFQSSIPHSITVVSEM